jgi:transitional endoplasmic reticulum ATPase
MGNELLNSLMEALELSPDNVLLRLQVAGLLQNEQQYSEAAEQYQKVLEKSYGNARAQLGLGSCFYYLKKYAAAVMLYEHFEGELPLADQVLYIRSLIQEKNLPLASDLYQKVLAFHPGFSDPEIDAVLRLPSGGSIEGFSDMGDTDEESLFLEKPTEKFADVGGMQRIKEEISIKIIQPMKNPELYKAFGKKTGGGILLYGPPGCGKTFIAKATAGEIDAKFINIGLHDILDMWIGNSEKNLHEVFEIARRNAPCVLFFDEVDAMGASRSDLKHSAMRHVINQFLSEMDGVHASNEGVLILAATNAPWSLDAAFRRPGRFDRIIFVEPPDAAAREEILESMLAGKPAENIDLKKLSQLTEGFSGADLKAVVDIAVESVIRESMSKGSLQPLQGRDLLDAARQHRPTTQEWFSSARNYALYSNESGLYDDILKYLKIKK